ncbi:MAG: hypothetical protein M3Q65_26020 [Chloroflexota bacterium]|nr:hypothetical protein [Chloroflexota bacterium]
MRRTTPCRLGLFSVVVLPAHAQAPWYAKPEATCAAAPAAVCRHLWASWNRAGSAGDADPTPIPRPLWDCLHEAACYAA